MGIASCVQGGQVLLIFHVLDLCISKTYWTLVGFKLYIDPFTLQRYHNEKSYSPCAVEARAGLWEFGEIFPTELARCHTDNNFRDCCLGRFEFLQLIWVELG